jgi:hypothetical protein
MGIEQAFDFLVNLLLRGRILVVQQAFFMYFFHPLLSIIVSSLTLSELEDRSVGTKDTHTRPRDAALDMHNMGQPTNIPVFEHQRAAEPSVQRLGANQCGLSELGC